MSERRKSRWVYELGTNNRYLFANATPLEALQKMIYTLDLNHKCNPTINETDSGLHLWFMKNGTVYATENY